MPEVITEKKNLVLQKSHTNFYSRLHSFTLYVFHTVLSPSVMSDSS